MIQRKRKQIVYNTEGVNYIRLDFNIKSTKASAPAASTNSFSLAWVLGSTTAPLDCSSPAFTLLPVSRCANCSSSCCPIFALYCALNAFSLSFSAVSESFGGREGFCMSDRELNILRGKQSSTVPVFNKSREQINEVDPTDKSVFSDSYASF